MTTITHAVADEEVRWDPPGPGTWRLDRVHMPRPATRHFEWVLPALAEGFADIGERYGVMLRTLHMRCVNGFIYGQPEIAFEAVAERVAIAEETFATRRWRDDVVRWDTVVKPASLARHRELIAVDPDGLDDAALAAYVRECADHHYAMWVQHHEFNGTHMIPVGDFLVAAAAWTGLPNARVALTLSGASPISRGACPEAEQVARLIDDSAPARAILASDAPAQQQLDDLLDLGGDLAAALTDWLTVTGYRLVDGFDVSFPYALERPELLVAGLRAARRALAGSAVEREVATVVAEVRAAVPAEHRAEFDARYEEARLTSRIRDERGIYSDATAAGLMRRALLAAGRRLEANGVVPDAALGIEADADEIGALLAGSGEPSVAELEGRAARRRRLRLHDAPLFLGDPPPPGPPPLDGLPAPMVRVMTALMSLPDEELTPDGGQEGDSIVLRGVGASPGVHRGRARMIHSPDDFARLEEGDVMITVTTGEAFNVAIAAVAALVTEQGGVLSHAGITAREFGIPAVLGVEGAMRRIADGDLVEVDGGTGTVRMAPGVE